VDRGHIARLNSDGSLDAGFGNGLAGASSSVCCLALQPDGKVLLGGYFNTVNGVTRHRIARLKIDGSLDESFGNGLPGADEIVKCMAVQPDGKILIGGYFLSVNGQSRGHLARLNSDGTLDQSFADPKFNREVCGISIAGDGTILVAGYFNAVGTVGQRFVARLYGDRPRLNIAHSGTQGTAVFWPAGWADCALEETCDLSLPWKDVQQPPTNDGTNWTVTFPLSGAQYLRLKR
jgi:uncharacterized delta-60 repeat protein